MHGINQVTEALEQGKLDFAFICKEDVKPPFIIAHFPVLCRMSGTHLITMPKGSAEELALASGVESKSAIDIGVWGIAKDADIEFVNSVKNMLPPTESIKSLQPLQINQVACIPNLKRRARKEAKREAKKAKLDK